MAKRTVADSALAAAALAFDDQLVEYGRLAELLLRSSLATETQLARANQTLEELGATEQRLEETGRALAQALADARSRQEALAHELVARLPAVQDRNRAMREVVEELQGLGASLQEVNQAAAGGAAVREVEERVTALADRALALSGRARESGFDELGTQAHAMHQQMQAVVRKLKLVTSRQS